MVRVEILQLATKTILAKQLSDFEDEGFIVTGVAYWPVQGALGKVIVTMSDFGKSDAAAAVEAPAKTEVISSTSMEAPIVQAQATFDVTGDLMPPKNGKTLPPPEIIPPAVS